MLIRQVLNKQRELSIAQISREANAKVDILARLASSPEADLREIKVEHLIEPSIAHQEAMEVDEVDSCPSWMDPITVFLSKRALIADKAEARCVRYNAVKY